MNKINKNNKYFCIWILKVLIMDNFITEYKLQNVSTGNVFEDTGWLLNEPNGKASLIRAVYAKKHLELKEASYGIYKFADWLPICRWLEGSSAPITYKSHKLAQYLGINNLYITFNGYFPEIGAMMTTCSFKETEAYSVCARLKHDEDKVLVVSSAGNTARAFAKVCSENNIKLLLCVPFDNINALWFDKPLNDCVKLISSKHGSDYFDAISLGNIAIKLDNYFPEGGAKNIARRDGMGTTVLSAATEIGEIPDYYFQAVGSGTGAIAAWEANIRLNEDNSFKSKNMQLMLSVNYPFIPMYNAWKADSRALLEYDDDQARIDASIIDAKVLSNRKPPYSIAGGVYDALKATNGEFFSCTNNEIRSAMALFERFEGIDIYSAAGVATASLIKAVNENKVDRNKIVMLNITGGGEKRFLKGREIFHLKPSRVFPINPREERVLRVVEKLF